MNTARPTQAVYWELYLPEVHGNDKPWTWSANGGIDKRREFPTVGEAVKAFVKSGSGGTGMTYRLVREDRTPLLVLSDALLFTWEQWEGGSSGNSVPVR
jgi:hypothetical protein